MEIAEETKEEELAEKESKIEELSTLTNDLKSELKLISDHESKGDEENVKTMENDEEEHAKCEDEDLSAETDVDVERAFKCYSQAIANVADNTLNKHCLERDRFRWTVHWNNKVKCYDKCHDDDGAQDEVLMSASQACLTMRKFMTLEETCRGMPHDQELMEEESDMMENFYEATIECMEIIVQYCSN